MCSRTLFNEVFYREYRGLREDWLRREAEGLFEQVFQRRIFPGARTLLQADRDAGFRPVLVTGSPDFAVGPIARHLGFEDVIANTLVFENGVATGAIRPPILAAEEKAGAMHRLAAGYNVGTERCKAYSDSISDLPMLLCVGQPVAVNPDRRLAREARRRGWPILDLKRTRRADPDGNSD